MAAVEGNATPAVRAAVARLGNGGTLRHRLPLVEFTIAEKNDAGFLCLFAAGSAPYEVADGNLFFDLDEGRFDSRERVISVHALNYCQIQYLATPGCRHDKDALASTFYPVAAEDRGGGEVFFRFFDAPHPKNAGKCSFPTGEPLCLLLASDRNRLRNGNSAIYHDDLTGYWGECGPAHTLVVRDNDCEDIRDTTFDFRVPFSGRAVIDGNRLVGQGSDHPFRFGPGVAETVEI